MKIGRILQVILVLVALVTGMPVVAQEPSKSDDPVQLKGMIVKLQTAVLERDREIARLNGQVAELQLAMLTSAVKAMDPAVQKAAGFSPPEALKPEQKPVAPQTPPK